MTKIHSSVPSIVGTYLPYHMSQIPEDTNVNKVDQPFVRLDEISLIKLRSGNNVKATANYIYTLMFIKKRKRGLCLNTSCTEVSIYEPTNRLIKSNEA
jgi:hypothetical protein